MPFLVDSLFIEKFAVQKPPLVQRLSADELKEILQYKSEVQSGPDCEPPAVIMTEYSHFKDKLYATVCAPEGLFIDNFLDKLVNQASAGQFAYQPAEGWIEDIARVTPSIGPDGKNIVPSGTVFTFRQSIGENYQLLVPTNIGPYHAQLTSKQLIQLLTEAVVAETTSAPPPTAAVGQTADSVNISPPINKKSRDTLRSGAQPATPNQNQNSETEAPLLAYVGAGLIATFVAGKIIKFVYDFSADRDMALAEIGNESVNTGSKPNPARSAQYPATQILEADAWVTQTFTPAPKEAPPTTESLSGDGSIVNLANPDEWGLINNDGTPNIQNFFQLYDEQTHRFTGFDQPEEPPAAGDISWTSNSENSNENPPSSENTPSDDSRLNIFRDFIDKLDFDPDND